MTRVHPGGDSQEIAPCSRDKGFSSAGDSLLASGLTGLG